MGELLSTDQGLDRLLLVMGVVCELLGKDEMNKWDCLTELPRIIVFKRKGIYNGSEIATGQIIVPEVRSLSDYSDQPALSDALREMFKILRKKQPSAGQYAIRFTYSKPTYAQTSKIQVVPTII